MQLILRRVHLCRLDIRRYLSNINKTQDLTPHLKCIQQSLLRNGVKTLLTSAMIPQIDMMTSIRGQQQLKITCLFPSPWDPRRNSKGDIQCTSLSILPWNPHFTLIVTDFMVWRKDFGFGGEFSLRIQFRTEICGLRFRCRRLSIVGAMVEQADTRRDGLKGSYARTKETERAQCHDGCSLTLS